VSSVSAIVPVHFGGNRFHRCLESLRACRPGFLEIIVVADGETDRCWQGIEGFGVSVIVTSPGGPARARNIGARQARGDILFFVDADVTVPETTVAQIREAFGGSRKLTALIGSYDDEPGEAGFLSQYKNLLHHYVHQTSNSEASTFWGACGAIRREVFLSFRGFDERYLQPSIEDIELGHRLKRAGHRICLVKRLQVKHLKRWSAVSLVKTDFFQRAIPWCRLILSAGRLPNDLNLKTKDRLSGALAGVMVPVALASLWFPVLLFLLIPLAVALLVLNYDVYRFFANKRGWLFVLGVVPWHWFYFLYSDLAFGMGVAEFQFRRWRGRGSTEAPVQAQESAVEEEAELVGSSPVGPRGRQ
jgi:glycosyltransferase involved in cell wall biosynthesis